MLEAGFVIFRFAHYLAVGALFGIALFPLYGYPSRVVGLPARLTSWRDRALLSSAIGCLLTGILWLAFTTANMSGELRAAIDPAALLTVVQNTSFGHLWLVPSLINGNHNSSLSLVQLRRHVLGEQILGGLVLLIVSVLGTIEPAITTL